MATALTIEQVEALQKIANSPNGFCRGSVSGDRRDEVTGTTAMSLVRRGLLTRRQVGAGNYYRITEDGRTALTAARERIRARAAKQAGRVERPSIGR